MPIQKKSGNFFNDRHINVPIQKNLETYLMILVSIKVPIHQSLETYLMILQSIKVPIQKVPGNLFNYPTIGKCPLFIILVSMCPYKKSGNLFNDPRINKSDHTKKV